MSVKNRILRVLAAATAAAGLVVAAPTVGAAVALAGPTISVLPVAAGPTTGGPMVTVRGTNFVHVSKVLFGATAGTRVKVVGPTKLTVRAPARVRSRDDLQRQHVDRPGSPSC